MRARRKEKKAWYRLLFHFTRLHYSTHVFISSIFNLLPFSPHALARSNQIIKKKKKNLCLLKIKNVCFFNCKQEHSQHWTVFNSSVSACDSYLPIYVHKFQFFPIFHSQKHNKSLMPWNIQYKLSQTLFHCLLYCNGDE